jgi:hypothetical protein
MRFLRRKNKAKKIRKLRATNWILTDFLLQYLRSSKIFKTNSRKLMSFTKRAKRKTKRENIKRYTKDVSFVIQNKTCKLKTLALRHAKNAKGQNFKKWS